VEEKKKKKEKNDKRKEKYPSVLFNTATSNAQAVNMVSNSSFVMFQYGATPRA
jgi:hypothetical protein